MKTYLVATPEYGTVVPVLDYGQGPMEYGRDVVFIEAENKSDARVLGMKLLRQQYPNAFESDENPFTGLLIEEVDYDINEVI